MPQSNTGNWRVNDVPYGRGSIHAQTLEASFRHWRRAIRINEAENYKYHLAASILEKHHKASENRKQRIIQRLRQTLDELEAYKKVLESYRASKLRTLHWGYKVQARATPRTYQRQKLEMKIYDCGFSIDTLRSEVEKIIEATKPEAKRTIAHGRLLQIVRNRSNFIIDRRWTNEAMRKERRITDLPLPPVHKASGVVQASKELFTSLHK